MNKRLKALISILITAAFMIPTTIIFNEASATPNLIVSEIYPEPVECCENATIYAKVTEDTGAEIENVQVRFQNTTGHWFSWHDMENFEADFWRYEVPECNFNETGTWHYQINASNVTQSALGYWTTLITTSFEVVDTTPPEITDVKINGTSPPTTLFCCDKNVNFTAKITDTCCIIENASIWYDGPAGTGHWWMTKDGDDIWYYVHPHFNCTHVGLWNFTVNATDCSDNDGNTSLKHFTVEFRPGYIEKTYGEPKYEGPDPEPSVGEPKTTTWITSSTPINLTAPPCYKVWYRIWNFTHGWGPWVYTGKRWEEFTISDYYGRDSDECKHKIEYRAQDCSGKNYSIHHQYFYVDDTSPTTTKEYGEPYCENETGAKCITSKTPIYMNCTDGEWDVQHGKCPVGVNGTWYNITNLETEATTGWVFSEGNRTVVYANTTGECMHNISYYQTDWLGNVETLKWQHFYVDDTPPAIEGPFVVAPWEHDGIPKQEIGECVNISVNITTEKANLSGEVVLKVVVPLPIDPTVTVNMANIAGTNTWYYLWCDTSTAGTYIFTITAKDCLGNEADVSGSFIIAPLIDIDVTGIIKPDPTKAHNTAPTEVVVWVENKGILTVNKTDLHLQIYEEIGFQPEIDICDDFEACWLNWTAFDWDGDGLTWAKTERRSHSPTHSMRCTPCDRAVYAGNSHDSLVSKPITIPDWEDWVWLNFTCWVQGEVNPVWSSYNKFEDYLEVLIRWIDEEGNWTDWTTLKKIVDTGEKWAYPETLSEGSQILSFVDQDHWNCSKGSGAPWKWWGGIDLTEDLGIVGGDTIQINFTWISDPCHQFEGAYIDDVCILSMRGPLQPLVYQGYKFLHHPLEQGDRAMVKFPIVEEQFTPKDNTWYFFEVYSNAENDIDGIGDNNGKWRPMEKDPRIPIIISYWDPLNGVNKSIFFGDVHDGEVLDITAPWELELTRHQCEEEAADVPITVTVHNAGTLAEDIPVEVSVRYKLTNIIIEDHVEEGDIGWGWMFVAGGQAEDLWEITTTEYWSPTHSWGIEDVDKSVGNAKLWKPINPFVEGGLRWESMIKWNLPASALGAVPAWRASTYYWDLSVYVDDAHPRENPFTGFSDWTKFDADEFIKTNTLYWEKNPFWGGFGELDSLGELLEHMNERYGPPGQDVEDFTQIEIGFLVESSDGLAKDEGFWFDDFKLYNIYPGPEVWSETKTVYLEPCETATVEFTWPADQYSFYMIVGETKVPGDCNNENNKKSTETYIYHQAFYDDFEHGLDEDYWSTEDNTYGIPGNWTICDNDGGWNLDHYWYCGGDEGPYEADQDEVLQMVNPETEDGSFNLTGIDDATLEFNWWGQFEYDYWWDFGVLEISNDSGQNWWMLDHWSRSHNYLQNVEEWQHYSIELFNHSKGLLLYAWDGFYSWYWDMPTEIGITDEMHIRFHFLSSADWQEKGWFIDDVYLNSSEYVEIPWDGVDYNWTWEITTMFHDDMEDPDASEEKWINMKEPAGDKWHLTDYCFYPMPYDLIGHSMWCAHEAMYSNYNLHYGPPYGMPEYDSSPMNYYNNMDNKLILTIDLSDKYQAFLQYQVNHTFADKNDYGVVEISKDGGVTWERLVIHSGNTTGWEPGAPGHGIDITYWLPNVIQIRWRMISDETGTDEGWQIDNINITAKMDCKGPTTTCILNPPLPDGEHGWYVSPVEVTLTAIDNREDEITTYYRIDGGSWLTYTTPVTIGVDGEHTVDYYSVDDVGNEEAIKSCPGFKMDRTAPTGEITVPKDGYLYIFGNEIMPTPIIGKTLIIGPLNAEATASDATSGVDYVTFVTSKGSVEDAVSPYQYNLPFYLIGTDTLTVSVTDDAGNLADIGSVDYIKIL